MTEISNQEVFYKCDHQQYIDHQRTMILVLKQQIIRLQVQIIDTEKDRDENHRLYEQSLEQIQLLKQKLQSLKQNNESIIHTFKIFQRQFLQRDYIIQSPKSKLQRSSSFSQSQSFLQLIRKIKTKFEQQTIIQPITIQKSYISDYYGYFCQEDIQQQEKQLYEICSHSFKVKNKKIRSFGKKNYFNEGYRHYFWFHGIQNQLRITQKQYQFLIQAVDGNIENQGRKKSIIDLDLKRMNFKVDQQKTQSIKVQVKKCLEIFKLFRPDIGYVQGMSYIAWMLLIRMERYQAFVCFSNFIVCDNFINSLYTFKGENIKRIIKFFDECLQDKRPKLHKHMKNIAVQPQLFLIQWAYTMFTRSFSLRIASKIWDLWISEGYNVFYKVAMTVLQMLQTQIMEQNENDKIIQIIKNKTHKLDENQFLKNLLKKKLFQDFVLE